MTRIATLLAAVALLVPLTAFSAGSIAEAKLGTDIVDREISGETTSFSLNDTAYLWMRVVDGEGETITVRWANGDQVYDVTLDIGSNSWRTWSSKVLHIPGEWIVTVTDASGTTLHQATLTVQ